MKGLSKTLVAQARQVAKVVGADSVVLCADAFNDPEDLLELQGGKNAIKIVRAGGPWPALDEDAVDIHLPELGLARLDQVRLAIIVAISRGVLQPDDIVVCLAGPSGSGVLDTMVVMDIRAEFEVFGTNPEPITEAVDEAVFEQVLSLAGKLAREGREGRHVGTTFVLGDAENVAGHIQQMILNPLEGHPRKRRNLMDSNLLETIRELSALDGAFVVDREGVLLSAGTYIDAPTSGIELRQGLGSRHYSAAAVTKATKAVAVVLSESSGGITIFKNGEPLIELLQPEERGSVQPSILPHAGLAASGRKPAATPSGRKAPASQKAKKGKTRSVRKKKEGS